MDRPAASTSPRQPAAACTRPLIARGCRRPRGLHDRSMPSRLAVGGCHRQGRMCGEAGRQPAGARGRSPDANSPPPPSPRMRTCGPNGWLRSSSVFKDGQRELTLPLDVRGTAFQWRVWRALQRIPAGETRSYSEVAGAVGRPAAVRAVANACARNPVCLVIPCHRVVAKNGGLGGYRWGAKRKERLLAAEAAGRRRGERPAKKSK